MAQVENLRKRGWLEYIGGVDIRRLPPVSGDPKDGDVHPVFTGHERGFEEAYVFFYWNDRRRSQPLRVEEKPSYTVSSAHELVSLIASLDC